MRIMTIKLALQMQLQPGVKVRFLESKAWLLHLHAGTHGVLKILRHEEEAISREERVTLFETKDLIPEETCLALAVKA